MRPPDLPGGNGWSGVIGGKPWWRFNEAAGFTRRKRVAGAVTPQSSMNSLQ